MTLSAMMTILILDHDAHRRVGLPELESRNLRLFDQMRAYCRDDGSEKQTMSELITQLDMYLGIELIGQLKRNILIFLF